MKLHLIQSHVAFGPPERQEELKECWRRNAAVFDAITAPTGRLTFAELFALCRPDAINVIMNSDIYMEKPLIAFPEEGEVWALSRWDVDPTGVAALWNHRDSQDTYIVRGGPHIIDAHTAPARKDGDSDIYDRPFVQGIAGCDNRLMHVLRAAGYRVTNPSKTIRTYHLHLSKYRSYVDGAQGDGRGGRKLERIQPPYAFEAPTEL